MNTILYIVILTLYAYNILLYVNDDLCGQDWLHNITRSRALLGRFLLFAAMIVGASVFAYRFQHIHSTSISTGIWSHHLLFLAGLMVQNRTKEIKVYKDIVDDLRCLKTSVIESYRKLVNL